MLVQDEIHRHIAAPALSHRIRIPHQLDEQAGKEEGREKIKGGVLVAGDAEEGAFLFGGQLQVDLVKGSDLADQLRLEHLEPAAQAYDDAAPHRVGRLPKDVIGRFGRVPRRQGADHLSECCLTLIAEQLVYLTDVAKPFRVGKAHIEDQGLQKIHFAVVPEMVALSA